HGLHRPPAGRRIAVGLWRWWGVNTDFFTAPTHEKSARPYLMLGSGALSQWRSGATVDSARYAAYSGVTTDWVLSAVNLDRIPGSLGEWATPEESELTCIHSYQNWKWLQRETGAVIMPVVHQE